MAIYYSIFIISFLLCIFDFVGDNRNKFFVYFSFITGITLVAGLRDIGIDNDSLMYEGFFQCWKKYSYWEIFNGDFTPQREIGYVLLNKTLFVLGFDFRNVMLFMSIFSAILTYSFIYKFSPYPFISLLFYLSFFYLYRDFTQIRYSLSCAILFWAIFFYSKKRYLFFFSFWLLALLFHKTALILLIVLPFLTLNKKNLFYFLFPIVCSFGIFINVFLICFSFLETYSFTVAFYLEEKGSAGFVLSILGYSIMLLYYFLSTDFIKSEYNLYFRLICLGVGLNLLFFKSSVFQRFNYLFFQFAIILLPILIWQLNKLNNKYFKIVYFGFAFCFLIYGCHLINIALLRPYKFCFSLDKTFYLNVC